MEPKSGPEGNDVPREVEACVQRSGVGLEWGPLGGGPYLFFGIAGSYAILALEDETGPRSPPTGGTSTPSPTNKIQLAIRHVLYRSPYEEEGRSPSPEK